MSFANINDADIEDVENFLKNDLIEIMKAKCSRENNNLDDAEKVHFFGIFEFNTSKFRFLPGDKKLITGLVQRFKDVIDIKSKEGLASFQMPDQYKISRKDTSNLSIGVFFASKGSQVHAADTPIESKSIVCCKLNAITKSLKLCKGSKFLDRHIKIVNVGNKIRADVNCAFCEEESKTKVIVVQCETRNNKTANYWNFANLKKHLKIHIDSKQADPEDIDQFIMNEREQNEAKNVIQNVDDVDDVENKTKIESYERLLYQQFMNNNLEQTKKRLSHNESIGKMAIVMNGEVKSLQIIKIDGDGRCLYAALAHQIFDLKVNSVQHNDKTNEVREQVVEHIRNHMDDFEMELTSRVLDIKTNEDIHDMAAERKFIVNVCLPKKRFWGGGESIKAISIIYKVNIVSFDENGFCYFATDFNPDYNRCVIIAYRYLGETNRRNHYDSVNEVNEDYLYSCIQRLIISKIGGKNDHLHVDLVGSEDENIE